MSRLKLLFAGTAVLGIAHAAAPAASPPAATTAPAAPSVVAAAAPAAPAPTTNYQLVLVDLQGQKKVLGTLPGSVVAPRVSPDGRRVAFEMLSPPVPGEPQLTQIYVASLDSLDKQRALQSTVTARRNVSPVWSPNGDWIAFLATGNGGDSLFREHSDGWIQPKYLVDGRAPEGLYSGGQMQEGRMTFLTLKGDKDYGISMLDLDTKKATTLVDIAGSAQHSSAISPDGQWLAYVSDETGRAEVWAQPMPPVTGPRVQLTTNGGNHPEWSPDGKQLYFDQGGQVYRIEASVLLAGGANKAAPTALPIKGFQQTELRRQYDLMPDGKGFVMLFAVTSTK